METLEQRTGGGTSWAGKALRIGAYVALTALGAVGGYYAGRDHGHKESQDAFIRENAARQELQQKTQAYDQLRASILKAQYEAERKKGTLPEVHKDP